MPQQVVVSKLARRVGRTFGQVAEVQVDLRRRDTRQLVAVALPEEDTPVVGADDLNIGALVVASQVDGVGDRPGVAMHVDGVQPEASEPRHCPCGW